MSKLILSPVNIGAVCWEWDRTYVFGILNITPDSFSDDGLYGIEGLISSQTKEGANEQAVNAALKMIDDGADVIDIGGESTRPGSERISASEELSRVIPVIEGIRKKSAIPLSIDTYKSSVAHAAIQAGANIVNDISGAMMDEAMFDVVASLNVPIIVGHLRGRPETMQRNIVFNDVVREVGDDLRERIRRAQTAGIANDHIWIDPGIGFGKTALQCLTLLASIDVLVDALGHPVMVGCSRKSFIGEICDLPVSERDYASAVSSTIALMGGAHFVRVHNVSDIYPTVRLADAIVAQQEEKTEHRKKSGRHDDKYE